MLAYGRSGAPTGKLQAYLIRADQARQGDLDG
jgi:hypothetical protein